MDKRFVFAWYAGSVSALGESKESTGETLAPSKEFCGSSGSSLQHLVYNIPDTWFMLVFLLQ